MVLNKPNFILFLLLSAAMPAFAAEHGAAPAAEEGGEAKAEGGAAVVETSKEQRQFTEKSAKLKTLATRIEDTEKEFKNLVEEKEHLKNKPAEIQAILAKMVEVAAARNKAVDDYNKLKDDIEFKYPGEGQQGVRQYQTQTKKSVEEMEGVAGLDELLTRTKKVVEKKFVVFADEEAAKEEERKKLKKPAQRREYANPALQPAASETPVETEKTERLRLEK